MSPERELVNELLRKYLHPDGVPSPESIALQLDVLTLRVAALEQQLRDANTTGEVAE